MALCNCMNCNKLINSIRSVELCSECDKLLFDKVKEYLKENPDSTLKDISDNTSVKEKIIKAFIKDGRLENVRKINTCQSCGDIAMPNSPFCKNCYNKYKLIQGLNQAFKEEKDESKNKSKDNDPTAEMHFLNRRR